MPRHLVLPGLLFAGALAIGGVTACSSDSETSTAASSTTAESTTTSAPATINDGVEVAITNFAFTEQTVTVEKGETVTWTNDSPGKHTVTAMAAEGAQPLFESETLQPEQAYQQIFNEPGTYEYFCSVHPEKMTGTIVVE